MKDGLPLALGTNYFVENGTLIIRDIDIGVAGSLICNATNKFGNASETFDVDVLYAPSIVNDLTSRKLTAVVGDRSLEIHCNATGNPKPDILWMKDGLPLTLGTNYFVENGTLIIRDIDIGVAGSLICNATNKFGNASETFDVDVLYAPSIVNDLTSRRLTAVVGDRSLEIHCNATGNPKPDILWMKDGLPLTLGTNYFVENGTLIIRDIDIGVAGSLICNATNKFGNASETFDVDVLYAPSIVNDLTSRKLTAVVGDRSLEIHCNATGNPKPDILWMKDGLPLTLGTNYFVENGTLIIRDIDIGVAGSLICNATNKFGNASETFDVDVLYAPSIVNDLTSRRLTAVVGDRSLEIHCNATGNPKPDILWMKDGLPLTLGTNYFVENGTLIIRDIDIGVAGSLICNATNKFGNASETFDVDVLYAPSIVNDLTSRRLTAVVGDRSLEIHCNATGNPKPDILWMKDGLPLTLGTNYFVENGTLIIRDIDIGVAGSLICNATNKFGNASETFDVDVLYAPSIVNDLTSRRLTAVVGDRSLEIHCNATGNPKPDILWMKDGLPLTLGTNYFVENGTLIIRDIDIGVAGSLICNATNKFGNASETFDVDVLYAPSIVNDLTSRRLTAVVGDRSLEIHCNATGNPKPDILWMKDGLPLTLGTNYFVENGTLIIRDIDIGVAGSLICNATNKFGNASETFDVDVLYAPSIVNDLTSRRLTAVVGDRSLEIHCNATGNPKPDILWMKDGLPLTLGTNYFVENGTLIIRDIDIGVAGSLICNATNKFGNASETFDVDVLYAPSIVNDLTSRKLTAVVGDRSLEIHCNATGNPKPDILWMKDGLPLTLGTNYFVENGTLIIRDIDIGVAGSLICNATNKFGNASETFDVDVLYAPSIVNDLTSRKLTAVVGDRSLEIHCNATGNPKPDILWMKDGLPLTLGTNYFVENGTLIIRDIDIGVAGSLICNATNKFGNASETFDVDVLYAPSIVNDLTSRRLTAVVGDRSLEIHCNATGNPKPDILWMKDGLPLTLGTNYFVENGTLIIRDIDIGVAGSLICNATNKFGNASETFDVDVLYAPSIVNDLTSRRLTAVVGDRSLEIHCNATGNPKPDILWMKDGLPLTLGTNYFVENGTLIIRDIDIGVAGSLICNATNKFGNASETFDVDVLYAPSIVNDLTSRRLTAVVGDRSLEIHCNATGNPKPDILWMKDGLPLTLGTNYFVENGTLIIRDIDIGVAGSLICNATNKFGNASETFDVDVLYAPSIVNDLTSRRLTAVVGDRSLEIHCNATGNPKPDILWMKDGLPLTLGTNYFVENGTLIIRDIDIGVAGSLICNATNKFGNASETFDVDVLYAPSIVNDLTSRKLTAVVGDRSLEIHCNATGNPKPDILWMKDGLPLTLGTNYFVENGTLIIRDIDIGVAGSLICNATNKFGNASETFDVDVLYAPSIVNDLTSRKLTAVVGDRSLEIHCNATGNPKPDILWMKDGLPLTLGTNYFVENGTLIIRDIDIGVAGSLICNATNKFGNASETFDVDVLYAPSIVNDLTSRRLTAVVGDRSLEIHCNATGNPKPDILWMKDGLPLTLGTNYFVENGTLIIRDIDIGVAGSLICNATNKFGNASETFDVDVLYAPSIVNDLTSRKLTAVVGDRSLEIHCNATGNPKPDILWMKDGLPLTLGTNYFVENGTLIIRDIDIGVAGSLICNATNKFGNASETFDVDVLSSPELDIVTNELCIHKDKISDIECTLPHSTVDSVRWYKGKSLLPDTTLTLFGKPTESDVYTCRVSNVSEYNNYQIKISICLAPEFVANELTMIDSVENNDVLSCETAGYPTPQIIEKDPAVAGDFTETAESNSESNLDIKASTDVSFQYGFLVISPSTVEDCKKAVPRPVAGEKTHLTIELSYNRNDVELQSAEILDLKGNLLEKYPLRIIKKGDNFYVTDEFISPSDMFRITVNGIVTSTKENIRRDATTAVDPWNKKSGTDSEKEVMPIIAVLKITNNEKTSKIQITCNVKGFPEPEITLFDAAGVFYTGHKISNNVSSYVSIFETMNDLDNIFICKATNLMGLDEKSIAFKPLSEAPKIDAYVNEYFKEWGQSLNIFCRVTKGKPKPSIQWFYKHRLSNKFTKLPITGKTLHINKLGIGDTGIYKCKAYNPKGFDSADIQVYVLHPPYILTGLDKASVIVGELVSIDCDVIGLPLPSVRWFYEGWEITSGGRYNIYRNHTLSFIATISDTGVYKCEASNRLGDANKEVHVDVTVFIPASIKPPHRRVYELGVGSSVRLDCVAEGTPKPTVKWLYKPFLGCCEKIISSTFDNNTYALDNILLKQAGYYICTAQNSNDDVKIYYEVYVDAPPSIVNNFISRKFTAVVGDISLKIPCYATGHPKPDILWMKDGLPLALGTNYFVENRTLIIRDIDSGVAGSLICKATNKFGVASEIFEVDILSSPELDVVTNELCIHKDKISDIKCKLPHSKLDSVRWYKGKSLLPDTTLTLFGRPTESDVYTCRVSNLLESNNYQIKISVCLAPEFVTNELTTIDYVEDYDVLLSCEATGYPTPQMVWYHNERKLRNTEIYLRTKDFGTFICEVSNAFGEITRTYSIVAPNCTLDVRSHFAKPEPLLLTGTINKSKYIPRFDVVDYKVNIPKRETIFLHCRNSYVEYHGINLGESINAVCDKDSIFKTNIQDIDYRDVKCHEPVKASFRNSRIKCSFASRRNTIIMVGYEVNSQFLAIYEVCFNIDTRLPIYIRNVIHKSCANLMPSIDFEGDSFMQFHFDSLYDCDKQNNHISKSTWTDFYRHGGCFEKQQMVNPKDLFPGMQAIAFKYMNVAPQWSHYKVNWAEIERRVVALERTMDHGLNVWSGVSEQLSMPTPFKINTYITISDRYGRLIAVPKYFWKIVCDMEKKACVVIVQVNSPEISSREDAEKFVLCNDICDSIGWLKNPDWKDYTKGYTYCCNYKEFNKKFNSICYIKDVNRVLV
ncbi:hemicentin-1-like [Pieris rapae]|uniref:hemicentin-1-like n=1 Tax=Pieris rapae TaxID=64459 RepID=UPI001E27B7A9|nr:hemicentin-1-like [Pieris rapae]